MDSFAIFQKALKVQFNSPLNETQSFFPGLSNGDASGQVRHVYTKRHRPLLNYKCVFHANNITSVRPA